MFLNLKKDLDWLLGGFYWIYTLDFRGRLYVESAASYQSAKIFRHIYGYKESAKGSAKPSIIAGIEGLIDRIYEQTSLAKDYPKINRQKHAKELFWLFLEIAKIFKNSLLSPTKYALTTDELVDIGIKHYACSADALGLESKLALLYIREMLHGLGEGEEFNYIVFKDATASALQLLTLILNLKNPQLVKVFNLASKTTWYDPYSFVIGQFIQQHKVPHELKEFFTRNTLKKAIMTYNYSATLHTCLRNFYEEVKIKERTASERKQLTETFVSFYRYLEQVFNEKEFFESSIEELNTQLLSVLKEDKTLMIALNDEANVFLEYYLPQERRANITNELGGRMTAIFWGPGSQLDFKKTTNALKPNTIHALDAALVRLTIIKYTHALATIHDCFGAPLNQIDEVIELVNENLNLIYYRTRGVD